MKIRYLFFLFLILFLIPSIFLIVWNTFFHFWNFVLQNNVIKSLENIFWWDYYLQKWNIYYRYGDFKTAIEKYENYECKNDCEIKNHNLWNSYYRLWEKETNLEKKIFLYQKSIFYYKEALSIKFDEKTKFNHDFVLEKLKELEKQKEENKNQEKNKNQEEQKGEQKNGENEKNKENQSSFTQNEEQEQQAQSKQETIDISKDVEKWSKKLNETERQMIEKYLEELKEEEKQNRSLNNKNQKEDIFDILRWQFFENFDNWWSDW